MCSSFFWPQIWFPPSLLLLRLNGLHSRPPLEMHLACQSLGRVHWNCTQTSIYPPFKFSYCVFMCTFIPLVRGVGGRAFPANTDNLTYARLPAGAQRDVNSGEWAWSLTSTGK